MEATPSWNLGDLPTFTAVAEDISELAKTNWINNYDGQNCPGQLWSAYRSVSLKESEDAKNLHCRITDLLTPSTKPEELDELQKQNSSSTALPFA